MTQRLLYTAWVCLLLPFAWLRLIWRALREPGYARHMGERFGLYRSTPQRPVIWVHAVSVGETRAAAPLITRLRERYPQHQILLTHMTPTGRATAENLFGDAVLVSYLPYDFPLAVARFLAHYRPVVGLIMETEVWPNLIFQAHRRGVPLWLINARLSEKSARSYARISGLTRQSLQHLSGICAQTQADIDRLRALGAEHIHLCGNVKFDVAPPEAMLARGRGWRQRFRTRPVFLAASTREGEEALVLEAIERMAIPELLSVIVPRHPQRFDAVETLITSRALKVQRRSANTDIDAAVQVVLGDSMGEMFAYYAACDIAFIGGSLLPLGGQNLIEACTVGKPVIIGPHTFNFAEATEQAIAAGAALRVDDAEQLAQVVTRLFADPAERTRMGQAGLSFSQAHRGAVARILAILEASGDLPRS
jgi:3-deoxy-D-manno-octulosonic-acid transferase